MGFYTQGPTQGKARFLVEEHGAKLIVPPHSWQDNPAGKAV